MTIARMRFALAILLTTCLVAVGFSQDSPGQNASPIFLKVSNNREIGGTPVDLTEVKVTTSFGEVSIPLEKIVGIKLHADGQDSAVIAFKNGDLVTGNISLEVIKVKTTWGTAHVNTSQIDSVTMDSNAKFSADTIGGGWKFTRGKLNTPQSRGPLIIPVGSRK